MSHPRRIQQTMDLLMTDIPSDCWEEINAVPVPDPEDPEKNRWT